MTPTDVRVPPHPAGALCRLVGGHEVRAYADIWPGVVWDGKYRVISAAGWSGVATHEQLTPIGGAP